MAITPIKIAADGTVGITVDSAATFDVPEDGWIVGILAQLVAANMLSNVVAKAELSFNSTNQLLANDSRGAISEIGVRTGAITTSGASKASENFFQSLPEGIVVNAGERLHLHIESGSSVIATASFIVYFSFSGGGRRAARRR